MLCLPADYDFICRRRQAYPARFLDRITIKSELRLDLPDDGGPDRARVYANAYLQLCRVLQVYVFD